MEDTPKKRKKDDTPKKDSRQKKRHVRIFGVAALRRCGEFPLGAGTKAEQLAQQLMMADRKALKAIFDEIDTDGGGSLDRAEVAQLAVTMGALMSEHELDAAMAEMDADGSGDVDFEELTTWFTERKTASPLADLLAKKLPTNETGLERELLKVVKGVRDNALAAANFVPLDDVALQLPHRRRRAIIPANSFGHARPLQPANHAFRSQAQVGKTWSGAMTPLSTLRALFARVLLTFCSPSGDQRPSRAT